MNISACEYKSEFVCQSYQKCLSCWVWYIIKIAYAIANETSGSFVASQRADLRNMKSVVSVKSQAGCF